MTRFSVVVPIWSAEAFVDDCLWSVRHQVDADLEVVAVDDGSPDSCGALADRHARADGRVTVLHLARSLGVGAARNAGIARARGEYVVFLDADDTFLDDRVLAGLDADLSAAGDPDVLLFGYQEWWPCGLRFPPGYYEDFAWSIPAMLAAERLAAHPEHDSAEVRDVPAAGARNFLRSRTRRLWVIPPELLEVFERRTAT